MAPLTYVTLPLTLIFITLRLCRQINWSWWLVLSPSLIQVALYCFVCVVLVVAERNISEGDKLRRRYLDSFKR